MDVADLAARALAGEPGAEVALAAEAGAGSLPAQRALLDALLTGAPTMQDLQRAELLARFAALRGDVADGRRFSVIMWCLAKECELIGLTDLAHRHAVEAFSVLAFQADADDGLSVDLLGQFAPCFPRAAAEVAANSVPAHPRPDELPPRFVRDMLPPPPGCIVPNWEARAATWKGIMRDTLAAELVASLRMPFEAIRPVLDTFHPADDFLLESMAGWLCLAEMVADALGVARDGVVFDPVVN